MYVNNLPFKGENFSLYSLRNFFPADGVFAREGQGSVVSDEYTRGPQGFGSIEPNFYG